MVFQWLQQWSREVRGIWTVYVACVTVATLLPGGSAPVRALLIPGADRIEHFLAYLMMVFPAAIFAHGPKLGRIALFSFALSAVLELSQILVPDRSLEAVDLLANGLGVFIGYALGLLWREGSLQAVTAGTDAGS